MKALIRCEMEPIGVSVRSETARMTWYVFGFPILSYVKVL